MVLHIDGAQREHGHNDVDQGARRQVFQGLALPRLHGQERVPGPRQGSRPPPAHIQEGDEQPGQAIRRARHSPVRRATGRSEQQYPVTRHCHLWQQLQPDWQLVWRAAKGRHWPALGQTLPVPWHHPADAGDRTVREECHTDLRGVPGQAR